MSPARRDPERDRLLDALAAAVAAHPRSTMYELTLLVTTGPGQAAPDDGSLLGAAPPAGPEPITCALAADLLKELERAGRVRCVKNPIWRWEPAG